MNEANRYYAVGRRKAAIARVYLSLGEGKIIINRQPMEKFMDRETNRMVIQQPLVLTNMNGKVDLLINVNGGGISGQAGAIRHGLSRALCELDPELRTMLKRAGYLTRDARKVERKKYGLKKARKRFQYSKR
ncbi:MAG: 30S ribosomal protein S9 [Candidatus Alcyoniella australis]|nr:30S ribosomal protein S9 [Candidatus Alcyoniella australis]